MKDEKETLILNKYHTYDALIVVGTALVILGLIVFATVFTGVGSLGRASVIRKCPRIVVACYIQGPLGGECELYSQVYGAGCIIKKVGFHRNLLG